MRLIIVILLSTAYCLAFAETNSYESIAAFTAAQSSSDNKASVIISTEDDLNEDGIKDWVGVLTYGSPIQSMQIFVLYGQKNGSYVISGKSKAFEYGGYAIGDGELTEVKKHSKNSFSVGFSARGTVYKYIFKLHGISWELIGEDFSNYNQDEDQSISINYITGNFVSTKLVHGKNISINGHRKYPTFLLYGFDYYNPYGMEEFWK